MIRTNEQQLWTVSPESQSAYDGLLLMAYPVDFELSKPPRLCESIPSILYTPPFGAASLERPDSYTV